MPKIDLTKILGIAGALLGLAGTLISGMASDKKMKDGIAEEVSRQLSDTNKQ